MFKRIFTYSAFTVLMLGVGLTSAQTDSTDIFEFDVKITPDTVTIGQEIKLEITVSFPDTIELIDPDVEGTGTEFALKSGPEVESKVRDGDRITTYTMVLAAFETGDLEIPAYVFYWYDDENTQNSIVSPVKTIHVMSVLPADTSQQHLRDIIGPKSLPIQWLHYLLALVVAMIIAAIVYYLYKRKNGDIDIPEAPPEPPYDVAIRKLVELKTKDLPGKGQFKQFYIELSEIVKYYIQGRFEIIAVEATTYEIKRDLKHPELPRDKAETIINLLTDADMVKFAKHTPEPEKPVEDYNTAKLFVTSTKPMPVVVKDEPQKAEASR